MASENILKAAKATIATNLTEKGEFYSTKRDEKFLNFSIDVYGRFYNTKKVKNANTFKKTKKSDKIRYCT